MFHFMCTETPCYADQIDSDERVCLPVIRKPRFDLIPSLERPDLPKPTFECPAR